MMGGMGRGRGRGMDNRFGGEWGPGGGTRFDGTTYVIPADKCGLVIGKGKFLRRNKDDIIKLIVHFSS